MIHPSEGAQLLTGYNGKGVYNRIPTKTTDSLLEQTFSDLLEQAHTDRSRSAIDAAIEFNNVVNSITLNSVIPSTSIGQQLEMVAKTIAARQALLPNRSDLFC